MKGSKTRRQRPIKRLACLLAASLLLAYLFNASLGRAAGTSEGSPAWAAPSAMALRRISAVDSAQHESYLLNNIDCSLVTYREATGKNMQTGCFTPTAIGLLDNDNSMAIFNGTDEGLRLVPYRTSQVLVSQPGELNLIALDAASTGGSYIGLYKNPLASLQDQRDAYGELVGKKLTVPADFTLRGAGGGQLIVNAQTLAFSDSGSWLVVETLSGSFVRVNLSTLDFVAFAPAFGALGGPGTLKSQVAVSDDGRYVAIGNKDAATLKVYDLSACGDAVSNLKFQNCAAHDYLDFAAQQIKGFQAARHLRFVNDGLLSFEAQTSDPAGSGVYELAPRAGITSLIDYLGMGDSYTSGEGAFDYLAGTDTADNMCHLSVRSYPLLLARDLFGSVGGHSVACSGAVIDDVGSTSGAYKGQTRGVGSLDQLQQTQAALLNSIMAGYSPGYVAQQRFVRYYQPAITTVSVGGNDIGFGDILQKCVVPHLGLRPGSNTCYNTYEDRLELTRLIDRTVPRWTALYKQLLAEAPGTRLYVIGYPQIAISGGNCALNVRLNQSELEFSEELIDYLNEAIRQAAGAGGATYVDISQALAGHRLCETASYDVAVNGLTAGTDAGILGYGIFGKESYHPNALGQALIEKAILKQTHNLSADIPITPSNVGSQAILDAPRTGRAVNTLVPDDGLTAGVVAAGQSVAIRASGPRDGLRANTAYTIRLDGPGGPVIGTMISGAEGSITANITLPYDTMAGGHTIDITGQNQAGEPIDVTRPIYVPVSDNDADGDGIPDSLDTCPGAASSGQDDDLDGLDDSCDPLIGLTVSGRQNSPDDTNNPGMGNLGGSGLHTVLQPAQTTVNDGRPGQVLGAVVAGQTSGGVKTFKVPARLQARIFRRLASVPYFSNRLPWTVSATVVCLIILSAMPVKRLFRRTVQTT